ncbi:unnamed protein product [Brassica oleracea var. botrytis]|uniref:(rape) hypothetical protein n=1 Tax=Brassica napus TaxID=3708 RepID=A0A816LAK4_BRANA|nr:unnamed protein product [Brassica napus]
MLARNITLHNNIHQIPTEPDAGAPKSMKSTYNIFSNVPISLLTDILRKSTLL